MKKYVVAAIALLGATTGHAQSATVGAGELKLSGFADFRLTTYTIKDNSTTALTNPESGFGLEDGALYLNYQSGPLSVLVDVPFRRSKVSDSGGTTNPNASNNGNFLLGGDKAQAYGRYKVNDYLTGIAGQFDTSFGVEVNDSKDRFFGKTGLIYDLFLPVVHSGFMIETNYAGVTFKALSANPNNKGSLGSSASGDENYEYAGLVSYSNEWVRSQVGYLTRPINKADGSRDGSRNLLDVTLGTTYKAFSIDLEYSRLDDASKNLITTTTADKEDAATGMLGLVTYQISDSFTAGVRYEAVENAAFSDAGFTLVKKADAAALSLHYALSPALELRTEFISYSFKNLDESTWKAERFNIATLYKF